MRHQPIRDASGAVVAMANVNQPLNAEVQAFFADLAATLIRKQQREDPLDLRGERQQRARDRFWNRPPVPCISVSPAGTLCDRTTGHLSLHLRRTPGRCEAWADTSGVSR